MFWTQTETLKGRLQSTLAEVELPRAVIRTGQLDRLAAIPPVLARLDLFEIDDVVRTTAAAYQDPYLRSVDAIHLATASVAASIATLAALVTYDSRLAEAAAALGIPTAAPGVS
jgi:predicted nucleic acid-binding protein